MKKWREVIAGIQAGVLDVGSRTPVLGVPAWATLEVVTGGFATGELRAGGPLLPHELALAERLGARTRGALNAYYLGDDGRAELLAMIESGRFRIEIPEEGALAVVAWMVAREANDEAIAILEAIAPFFERLRFYPLPHERPLVAAATVHRETVGDVARSLRSVQDQERVLAMNETLTIWTPLYDRAVALVAETVVDGEVARIYPPSWAARATQLFADYAEARKAHRRSGMPESPKSGFFRLRGFLRRMLDAPESLGPGHRRFARGMLEAIAAKRGGPGSPELAAHRRGQAADAARPIHRELRGRVLARLAELPDDAGIPVLASVVDEGTPTGIVRKVERALDAPVEELVERGVVVSAEVLAVVLPQLTSQIRAAGIEDAGLRRLYAAVDAAFRKRRSLLLLDLASQVRLEELPWMAAMAPFRARGTNVADAVRASLVQISLLTITCFPQTILPNKLVKELGDLARTAMIALPLVDELAADIFMGRFSGKFLLAAREAATLLGGTLYERYYGIGYRDLGDVDLPAFDALCHARAELEPRGTPSVARNGKIIEQEQILTTHNLASLVSVLALEPALRSSWIVLAQRCFAWICEAEVGGHAQARLRTIKNCAYAWRQMIFFLGLVRSEAELLAFLAWADARAASASCSFHRRFKPALTGLRHIVAGGTFDASGRAPRGGRRFLGWTTEHHWALGPAANEERAPLG